MTIREAIAKAAQMRQPGLPEQDAIDVINEVEARIRREVTHPRDAGDYEPYTEADMDARLTAAAPYDGMYVHALCAAVDDRENQIGNLSNARRFYEYDFGQYAAWYLRTHRPQGGVMRSDWYGV